MNLRRKLYGVDVSIKIAPLHEPITCGKCGREMKLREVLVDPHGKFDPTFFVGVYQCEDCGQVMYAGRHVEGRPTASKREWNVCDVCNETMSEDAIVLAEYKVYSCVECQVEARVELKTGTRYVFKY